MSRQPDNQQRKEKPESESDRKAKPIEDRLAAVFALIGCICGLVATWGGVDNHHTTMILAIIVGVLSFVTAAFLHWVPNKTPNKDVDVLRDSLAQLRLFESASLSEPRAESRIEPIRNPLQPLKPPDGKLWMEYTEDVFHGVIWRWHYKPEIDNTPRDLTPYCPECINPQPLHHSRLVSSDKDKGSRRGTCIMNCPNHKTQMYFIPVERESNFGLFGNIKRDVQQKLKEGSWVEVVNKQRASRHEAPIVLPSTLPTVPDPLPEISILILRIFAKTGGSCTENTFYNTLNHLCYLDKKPSPDGVSIQFHLHELEDKQKYISIERGVYADGMSLTQLGRMYVIEHGLNKPAEDSN